MATFWWLLGTFLFLKSQISLSDTSNYAMFKLILITFQWDSDAQFELQRVNLPMALCLIATDFFYVIIRGLS